AQFLLHSGNITEQSHTEHPAIVDKRFNTSYYIHIGVYVYSNDICKTHNKPNFCKRNEKMKHAKCPRTRCKIMKHKAGGGDGLHLLYLVHPVRVMGCVSPVYAHQRAPQSDRST